MLFDLHVHSCHSACSRLRPGEILAHAADRGLDGVCITDHHSMAVSRDLREGMQANGLCLIFGMEYTTREGDFLIFGPFEELAEGLDAGQLLRHVNDAGGAAVAAHPFRRNRSTAEGLIQEGLCRIVEGVNGRNSATQNLETAAWRRNYGVYLTGGSDAHSLGELGTAATRLTAPVTSRKEFIKALRNRHFQEVRPDAGIAGNTPKRALKEPSALRPGRLNGKPSPLPPDCTVSG